MLRHYFKAVAVVCLFCGSLSLPVYGQDLRYPQLERPYQERPDNRPARPSARRVPVQGQPAPQQQAGRPFVHLPFFGRITQRAEAPPPRWPAAGQNTGQPIGQDAQPRAPRAAPPVVRKAPETVVAVIGDNYAQELVQGLDQLFSAQQDMAFVRFVDAAQTGFLASPEVAWENLVKQALERKNMHALVFFIGAFPEKNAAKTLDMDKPALLAQAYSDRMDKLLALASAKMIPVIWVGLPPVHDETASKNNAFINSFIWQRASNSKNMFVDVWEPFVDDTGNFTFDGLDTEGQITRLRTQEGRNFTRAGRRKIASYVATNIRLSLMRSGRAVAGLTDDGKAMHGLEQPKRAEGILLLSQQPIASDGQLAHFSKDTSGAQNDAAKGRTLQAAPNGRADDYMWGKP